MFEKRTNRCHYEIDSNMQLIVESNVEQVAFTTDESTGLKTFIIAASSQNKDLTSIYEIMRLNPLVQQ